MKLTMVLVINVLLAGFAAVNLRATLRTPEVLSIGELTDRVATARTPEDHRQLARYYKSVAMVKEAEADEYYALTERYRNKYPVSLKDPLSGKMAEHCRYLADSIYEAGKSARDLAAEHERAAKKMTGN